MSAEEDRRALQRFVAGQPVDADALATAITAEAMDHAIVDQALLRNLAADDPAVRRRTARRVARMVDVGEGVAARLATLASTDPDERTREAAATALQAHGRAPEPEDVPRRGRLAWPAALRFTLATAARSGGALGYDYQPLEPPEGPAITDAQLVLVDDVVQLRFRELPAAFVGTTPVVIALAADGGMTEIARATAPVSPAGDVTIALPAVAGPLDAVAARLDAFDLVVPAS